MILLLQQLLLLLKNFQLILQLLYVNIRSSSQLTILLTNILKKIINNTPTSLQVQSRLFPMYIYTNSEYAQLIWNCIKLLFNLLGSLFWFVNNNWLQSCVSSSEFKQFRLPLHINSFFIHVLSAHLKLSFEQGPICN